MDDTETPGNFESRLQNDTKTVFHSYSSNSTPHFQSATSPSNTLKNTLKQNTCIWTEFPSVGGKIPGSSCSRTCLHRAENRSSNHSNQQRNLPASESALIPVSVAPCGHL